MNFFIGALNILQRLLRKKESLGLKASKILSVVNALRQKKKPFNKYCMTGEAVQWAFCLFIRDGSSSVIWAYRLPRPGPMWGNRELGY